MTKFIVIDEQNTEHLIDAPSQPFAIMGIPGAKRVRVANHHDLLIYDEDYKKSWEEEQKAKKKSQQS